jgi:hypothetical protein
MPIGCQAVGIRLANNQRQVRCFIKKESEPLKFEIFDEMASNSRGPDEFAFENLSYFIRFGALNLLYLLFFFEGKNPNNSYSLLVDRSFMTDGAVNVSLLPFLSVELASFGFYPKFVDLYYLLALLFLFFRPMERLSYVNAVLAIILRDSINIVNVGVHTATIYAIPLLLLSLDPPTITNIHTIRSRLISAVGMMYLFSGINKLGVVFHYGFVVEGANLNRYFVKSLLKEYSDHFAYQIVTWSGILLQILASLIALQRFRYFGYFFALVFHFSVAVWIILSANLVYFGSSILFLLVSQRSLRQHFNFLLILLALLPYLQLLAGFFFEQRPDLQGYVFDFVSIALSWLAVFMALRQMKIGCRPLVVPFSLLGFTLPLIYTACAYIFPLPKPFGYTQYGGPVRAKHYVYLSIEAAEKIQGLLNTSGRWDTQFMQLQNLHQFRAQFPNQMMVDKYLEFICDRLPSAEYKLTQAVPKRFGKTASQAFFDNLPSQRCDDEAF